MKKVLSKGADVTAKSPYFSKNLPYLQIPPHSHQPKPYTGPSYQEVLRKKQEFISKSQFTFYKDPVLINEGSMQYLYDHTGKRYLDMAAGFATTSIGHCHPRITEKLHEKIDRLVHCSTAYLNDEQSLYAEELTQRLPEGLDTVFFCSSGSEAAIMAQSFARCYTGNYPVISTQNAYHGSAPCQHLTNIGPWNYNIPKTQGVEAVCFPDTYRGYGPGEDAGDKYADMVKNAIDFNTSGNVAMFVVESLQGAGGVHEMPKGFVKKSAEYARAAGGLYAADEVQCGFARTGTYWGFEQLDVTPDIVIMAKTMGNGIPMAGVAMSKEVSNAIDRVTLSTYSANPLGITAAREVLKIIDDEGLVENSRLRGEQLKNGLKALQSRYEQIGDVRGQGLLIGCEFVRDRESKQPIDAELFGDIFERTKDHGVLCTKSGRFGNILRFLPPLCITEEDVDFTLDVVELSIKEAYENQKK